MRIAFVVTAIIVSGLAQAQSKWEYGINVHFNSSFVKPVSSDTFTNKPGFGGGLMLERKFNSFSLQLNPSYSQTRYEHDFQNFTSISNALDISLLALQPMDSKRQTFFSYGFISSYNFIYEERHLSTQKQPIKNTLIQKRPWDFGYQLGVGLDLNPGARLTIHYMDFLNGKQHAGRITGQIDYLQLGIQVRFLELLSSERVTAKYEAEQQALATATQQVADLSNSGDGVLVFVIGTTESQKTFDTRTTEQKEFLRTQKLLNIQQAIRAHYTFGDYVITTDSLLAEGSILVGDSTESFDASQKTIYYAKIDQMFLDINGQQKQGIFVFDKDMNRLAHPFPYFTPYRQLDQQFSEVDAMIKSFNQSLNNFTTTAD